MSDHERRVEEFKKNCKEARYAEHQKLVLKKNRKMRQDRQIKQTNHMLNQMYHGTSMRPYTPSVISLKFKTPVPTALSQDELSILQWMDGSESVSDTISLPDTVKEGFSRFESQYARLELQYQRGNITQEKPE